MCFKPGNLGNTRFWNQAFQKLLGLSLVHCLSLQSASGLSEVGALALYTRCVCASLVGFVVMSSCCLTIFIVAINIFMMYSWVHRAVILLHESLLIIGG